MKLEEALQKATHFTVNGDFFAVGWFDGEKLMGRSMKDPLHTETFDLKDIKEDTTFSALICSGAEVDTTDSSIGPVLVLGFRFHKIEIKD